MAKTVFDKLKTLLTAKDLKVVEEAIDKMIAKKVSLKEEELKQKYDDLSNEYISKEVPRLVEEEKAKLVESYDHKIQAIEKKVVDKLSNFIDTTITENISDAALERIAINEVASPIVDKIMKVFSENYIKINSDGSALLKTEQKKVAQLENQLSEKTNQLMELEERAKSAASFLLISEKTEGLTRTQKARVVKMFKNKDFDHINENIDEFVDMIKESKDYKPVKKKTEKGTIDEIITEEDHIPEKKQVIKEDDEQPSFVKTANRFLADD